MALCILPLALRLEANLGTYSFKGPTMQIDIHNEAGAHSFFYHGVPNSPYNSGGRSGPSTRTFRLLSEIHADVSKRYISRPALWVRRR